MTSKYLQLETTSNFITKIQWFLCIGLFSFLVLNYPHIPEWQYGSFFKINGFTLLIWTLVTFFSALISSFGKNYLKGFRYHASFITLSLGFIMSIMLFIMTNHMILLIAFWLLMGYFMSRLIGVDAAWGEAKEASKLALKYFLISSLFLSIAVFLLAYQTQDFTLNGMISKVNQIPYSITVISGICIIISAIIQSAIYPFHRWLLSAMTAPTPASALMHAGFVNGSGILLALFSTVLFTSNTLIILFIIGGFTAIIAQFTKLIQVNVKQKLACSTIAQMGFMIMQCGLGFFNAAIVHLILHGFYKAYLFLSSGENIAHSEPQSPTNITIKPLQAIAVLIYSAIGAVLFIYLTGKSFDVNSSIFLTLIVAITVGQLTYNIVKEPSLSILQKSILPPILFISGMATYALMYNGVTVLMNDMPMVHVPTSVSYLEITFGLIFLIGFFIMKLGIYRKHPWIYVKLLNISQPNKKTVLMYKS